MLPAVLAQPPWPPPHERKVLQLTVPVLDERVVWTSASEQTQWAHPGGGAEQKLELWQRQEIVTKLQMKDIVRIDAATNLEKEDLLTVMRTCDARFLLHYGIVEVALAKYGLETLDAILELVRKNSVFGVALLRVDSLRVLDAVTADDKLFHDWTQRHPVTAALAAIPKALGPKGGPRKKAIKVLRAMKQSGLERAVRDAAVMYGPDASAEVEVLFAPEPLPSRAPSLPRFLDVASLPMPRQKDGEPIGEQARERLVQLVSLLPLEAARTAALSVLPECDRDSLAALGLKLAETWVEAGAETKHKWALLGAGLIGDDTVARQLAEWTIAWAKQGLHPRSRVALEALSMVGTDVALMHTDRIARTMKGALKTNATATLEAIAQARGLSQDELADRLVPSLGLDESGSSWLDFGPRRFRVSFDEGLVPEVLDESGARLPRLPRPAKTDDGPRAARAVAMFKGLAADAKKIAPDQVRRLDRAMCAERSWTVADFRRLFLEHPLMVHLARRLVWMAEPGTTFRATEDHTFAGQDDREVTLGGDMRVRIAHPIAISGSVAAWAALFSDYLIVQPFPQLGRETFSLDAEEARRNVLHRFEGRAVAGTRFYSLKHRGWSFQDYEIGKPLRGGYVAMLDTDPGLDFLASQPPDQVLGELSLRKATGGAAAFGELGGIDVSEVLRDVELLSR